MRAVGGSCPSSVRAIARLNFFESKTAPAQRRGAGSTVRRQRLRKRARLARRRRRGLQLWDRRGRGPLRRAHSTEGWSGGAVHCTAEYSSTVELYGETLLAVSKCGAHVRKTNVSPNSARRKIVSAA